MKTKKHEFFRIIAGIFLPVILAYFLGAVITNTILPDIQLPVWKIGLICVIIGGVLYLCLRWLFLWLLERKIYKNSHIYFWGMPD